MPRTARLAVSGHMNDCDLETQSWIGSDQVLADEPRVLPAFARPVPMSGSMASGGAHRRDVRLVSVVDEIFTRLSFALP